MFRIANLSPANFSGNADQQIYILLYTLRNQNNWWLFLAITGSSLKKLRTEARLTQKELAEMAGVSQAHIAKIERGKVDPRLSTVNRIFQALQTGKERRSKDIMTEGVIFAKPSDNVLKASEVMVKNAVSQLPVSDRGRIVGTITEESIVRNLRSDLANEKVRNVMDPPLPTSSEEASIDSIRPLLERNAGVLVKRGSEVVGIITRSDLLKTI
jgi:predicted transcriptional regulator